MTPRDWLPVLVFGALVAGCTTRVNDVQLTLTAAGEPTPLLCRTGSIPLGMGRMDPPPDPDAGVYLIDRARAAGGVRIVVDYFSITGGVPGCMPQDLHAHCTATCCAPLVTSRACVDVPLADAGTLDDVALADYILQSVHGQIVSTSAPDGYVLVRLVATTQDCASVAATNGALPSFVTEQLVGCAYSCPVVLSSVQGTLSLGLPTFNDQCATTVDGCAHEFDFYAASACGSADP